MIIYVDIDGTICHTENSDYENSKPRYDQIQKINKLHNEGNEIIYWTARGAISCIDWRDLTERQLEEWNVKYHELKLNKPYYDLFIDDRNLYFKKSWPKDIEKKL